MISDQRNMNIPPGYLGGHKTQQDSIQKIGMNFTKKKMNDRLQINCRGFHGECLEIHPDEA